jgi:SP family general alpha glucoside:H+ symporter-like MFS transporter
VRKGDIARAIKNQQRLLSSKSPVTANQIVALMVRTNELEEKMDISDSWWDCFKKSDLRRTEISCVCFAGQVLSGGPFAYNPTYFFEQAGVSTSDSYKLNVGGYAMAFIGTLSSWFMMRYLGRRTLFVSGLAIIVVLLFLIGFLDLAYPNSGAVWAQAVFVLLWLFAYSASVGPVGWSIPSEIGSTRLKQKTLCLARNTYYIVNIVAGVIEPYMMNPDEGNWRGKTGFFWGVTSLLVCVWAFFRLPEIAGRTYEELDILFHKKIAARKFKKTAVDAYDPSDDTVRALHE